MRHPFASVRYSRNSLSSDRLPLSEHATDPTLPAADLHPLTQTRFRPPVSSHCVRTSPGHFVKHSSKVTLLLSGQEDGLSMPVYRGGSTIDGVIAIPRPSGLLYLDVKVQGLIRIKEVAGGGSAESEMLGETLYTWDSRRNASFPSKVSFRYSLPREYSDRVSGECFPLPPTYEAHLSGIPGFSVHVSYKIVVNFIRQRHKANLWRKKSCVQVPFLVQQSSRCPGIGSFPLNPSNSSTGPQTLFSFILEPRHLENPPIQTHIFLPSSQVCSLNEPIPFFVTLFADEDTLAPFTYYRPSPASFHPLSSTASHTSLTSVQQQLALRASVGAPPIRVQLQRTTTVNALGAELAASSEKGHIFRNKVIGQGIVHNTSRGLRSITWSGTLVVSASVTNGGFIASGLRVTDNIVVSIKPPDSSQYMAFREAIPIRLTTEPREEHSIALVSEWL
ncbi:hypothetical protein AcW1_007355 [Taiwanofungus camphoratus]|nr:hypothetical protein AcW2_007577 [Antrodia cinnamomea]KAI0920066.1 hypothetical protein AcV7_006066 [Antrodia cinnamomea]KAI0927380.1 hypothetical protein AcV5_007933 [Antrodia cinnamomea]KAI0953031.1 hypothetical protein AcW1_007355 [Antrodia cinnamomea]